MYYNIITYCVEPPDLRNKIESAAREHWYLLRLKDNSNLSAVNQLSWEEAISLSTRCDHFEIYDVPPNIKRQAVNLHLQSARAVEEVAQLKMDNYA